MSTGNKAETVCRTWWVDGCVPVSPGGVRLGSSRRHLVAGDFTALVFALLASALAVGIIARDPSLGPGGHSFTSQ